MDELRYEGEGIFVRDGPFVKISVVLYWSELPVFLLDEEKPTGIGRFRSSDAFEPEILIQKLALFLFFSWRQWVDSAIDGGQGVRF